MMQPRSRDDIIKELFRIEAIQFGTFKLKSGLMSPIYFNLRVLISFPSLMREVSEMLWQTAANAGCGYSHVCGVPYTALPLATCMCVDHELPMVIRRREAKDYGTRKMIEGVFKDGDICLIVEDIVTSGGSVLETAAELNNVGMLVTDAVVLIDRAQGGAIRLQHKNIKLHALFDINEVLRIMLQNGQISDEVCNNVKQFIKENQFSIAEEAIPQVTQVPKPMAYADRRDMCSNQVAKRIFDTMTAKKTNLCFSVDVTTCEEVIRLANLAGPHICILKTHVDILEDFSASFVGELQEIAKKHDFVIFEDRKFADIGSTVQTQYTKGMYKIQSWAELTNAHTVPGDGVVRGLQEAASEASSERACLLIAQMSSSGALTTDEYIKRTVEIANENSEFVVGFICTSKVSSNPSHLHMTPGISMCQPGDSLGQQYLTPEEVIGERGCDVIIVGRAIYKADNPEEAAVTYKTAGYNAYINRLT